MQRVDRDIRSPGRVALYLLLTLEKPASIAPVTGRLRHISPLFPLTPLLL